MLELPVVDPKTQAPGICVLQGYQRTLILEGSLRSFLLGLHSQPDLRYIDREAVALLLEEGGGGGAGSAGTAGSIIGSSNSLTAHAAPLPRTLLVDVRRSEERALYGSIRGSVHVPRKWASFWFGAVASLGGTGGAVATFKASKAPSGAAPPPTHCRLQWTSCPAR